VVVYSDENTAIQTATVDNLKTAITSTATTGYGIAFPDAAVISFPLLNDGTAAVELSGMGSVGGQQASIGERAVSVRTGRLVVTIFTTSLGLGPISELEDIARTVSARLTDVKQ
jgi:hypothetical protein